MTAQEAIKGLEYLISGDCTDNQQAFIKEIEIAISALEKQIPKKPKIVKIESEYDTRDYFCPICNKCFIHFVDGEFYAGNKDCYCSNCGQALDWSDI